MDILIKKSAPPLRLARRVLRWLPIVLAVPLAAEQSFSPTDVFKRISLTAQYTTDAHSFSARAATQLLFRDAEIRVNGNFGTFRYDAPAWHAPAVTVGGAVSLPSSYPVALTVKGGMLSARGLYSRLKEPAPALPSGAFVSAATLPKPLEPTLPAATATAKPFALGVVLAVPRKKSVVSSITAGAFIQRTGHGAIATSLSLSLPHAIQVSAAVTVAQFTFGKTSSRWYNDYALFPANWFYAGAAAFAFESRFVSSVFTLTMHESPYGSVQCAYHTKTTGRFGPLTVTAGGFYGGQAPFYRGDGTLQKIQAQAYINPRITVPFLTTVPFVLQLGATAGMELSHGTEAVRDRLKQQYALGGSLVSTPFRTSLTVSVALAQTHTYRATLRASWSTAAAHPSISFAGTLSVPDTGTYRTARQTATLSLSGTPPRLNGRITGSCSATFVETLPRNAAATLSKTTLAAACSVTHTAKKFRLIGKITAEYSISR
ncbi:MAG: hypothetical protein IJ191_05195 [Treponema sp.]|nr:hypothetical protein [Treponema sp.]